MAHKPQETRVTTSPAVQKLGATGTAMLQLPPFLPMMMPPFMPMFGMMTSKAAGPGLMPSAALCLPGMPPLSSRKRPAAAAAAAPAKAAATGPTKSAAKPAQAAAAAAPVKQPQMDEDDGDLCLKPDEEVTLEPGELEVFEKVAAMERDKQQQQFERASSPSGSCLTAVTAGGSSGSPRSPVSTLQQPPAVVPFLPGMPYLPFPPGFPCMPLAPMPGCFPMPFLAAQVPQQQQQQARMQAQQQRWQKQTSQQQKRKQSSQQQWQKQAQQLWKPQAQSQHQGPQDAAPVPWTSFAADDCVDDLDKDLQEIIVLPDGAMQDPKGPAAAPNTGAGLNKPAGAPAAAAAAGTCDLSQGRAAAAKARSSGSSLRRSGSTASAYSSMEAFGAAGAAAGAAAGQAAGVGGGSNSRAQRVLRIRNIKGTTGADSAPAAGVGGAMRSRIVLKGSTAKRNNSNAGGSSSCSQHATSCLSVTKGGVQKRVTIDTSKNTSIGGGGSSKPAHAPQQRKPAQKQEQQDASLSLLCDLDSSLSGGDALTAGIAPVDDCWDAFMQEASDDGWDGLLGTTDIGLISSPPGL